MNTFATKASTTHLHPLAVVIALAWSAVSVSGQIVQTFEEGEDTSNWGADWVAPGGFSQNAPTFLDPSLGGAQAGLGSTQSGQEASRIFRNNTAGIDVATTPYTISLYVQLDLAPEGLPASGHFNVLDGAFGDYTANVRLNYNDGVPTSWEAADGSGWQDLSISVSEAAPYRIQFTVDPINKVYSTTVSQVNSSGAIQSTATLNNLAITGNAINNHQNGVLFFHADTSAGYVDFKVDNISVSAVPEPAELTVFTLVALGVFAVARRVRSGLARSKPDLLTS